MSVLFFGTVPGETQEQLIRVVPFEKWGQIFVGCSGSFRFEKVISATYPALQLHSNEVSLLSCSLGTLAVGQDFPLRFTGRLAWIEDMLGPDAPFLDRVAAVQVAQTMARYRGLNPYAQSYFAHYQERFGDFLAKQRKSIETFLSPVKLASFTSGDFRDQAGRAAEAGGGFICFPPTFRGDFEGHYRFLDQNTEWPRPDYRIWDPDTMEDLVDEQIERGTHYCCLIERKLTRHTPAAVFRGKIRPIYIYTDGVGSSVKRGAPRKAEPSAIRGRRRGATDARYQGQDRGREHGADELPEGRLSEERNPRHRRHRELSGAARRQARRWLHLRAIKVCRRDAVCALRLFALPEKPCLQAHHYAANVREHGAPDGDTPCQAALPGRHNRLYEQRGQHEVSRPLRAEQAHPRHRPNIAGALLCLQSQTGNP